VLLKGRKAAFDGGKPLFNFGGGISA
jgi:hypothetical protein